MPHPSRLHLAAIALASAAVTACGGGGSDSASNTIANTPACTTSTGSSGQVPAELVLGLFATIYELQAGTIDEFGAFIQTSTLIFKLAADGSATVDGNGVPVSSACYQASSNKLSLALGNTTSATKGNLDLLSGGRASGVINGKAVRSKPN